MLLGSREGRPCPGSEELSKVREEVYATSTESQAVVAELERQLKDSQTSYRIGRAVSKDGQPALHENSDFGPHLSPYITVHTYIYVERCIP